MTGPAATLVGTRSGSAERLAVGGSVGWADTTRTSSGGGEAGRVSRTGLTTDELPGVVAELTSAVACALRVKVARRN